MTKEKHRFCNSETSFKSFSEIYQLFFVIEQAIEDVNKVVNEQGAVIDDLLREVRHM